MKPRFGESLTKKEIRKRIKELCKSKQVKELDLLLKELVFRKLEFKEKIFTEMMDTPQAKVARKKKELLAELENPSFPVKPAKKKRSRKKRWGGQDIKAPIRIGEGK